MAQSPENAAFNALLAEEFKTDAEREQFERDVARMVANAELLAQLEDLREASNVSKAEIARRIGTQRSVVARLLSGGASNATLSRVSEVVDALDYYLDIRIKPQPKQSQHRHSPIELHSFDVRKTEVPAGPMKASSQRNVGAKKKALEPA